LPWALGAVAVLLGPLAGAQAAPQISSVTPRGLRSGATTTLTIDGTDLLPGPRLVLPGLAIASQAVKPGTTANRVVLDVTLADDVPPGLYQVRVATASGISNAVTVGIDDLPQVPVAPDVVGLPVALHGTLAGGATVRTTFPGRKGQRLVVDIEARRLGSAIDPLIELYDPRHVQLAWAQGTATFTGDARLQAVLPADGRYTVELHDALYQAGAPGQFRLKLGDLHYADLTLPLGVQRGTPASLELIGTVPPGTRVALDPAAAWGDLPAPLPRRHGFTGAAPRVFVSDFPEVVEAEQPAGQLQEVTVPAIINGRLGKPREEDRYRLRVQPGMSLRFDVVAHRVGSPLDGVLVLRKEAGGQLAANDDRPNTVDPGFDFTVPDGVTSVVVALTDLLGRGGPNFVYRLAITPTGRPDFSLTLFEDRFHVASPGTAFIRVRANRAGYSGRIKLSVPGLPAGVTVAGDEIPAGATDTLLALAAPAGVSPAQVVTQVLGESDDPKQPVRRVALLPEMPATRNQPWLRAEVAVAVTGPAPLTVAWDEAETPLPLGSSHGAKVQVTRAAGVTGAVRLALVTSQVVPKTRDGKQDDVNRALRLQGMPTIPANQTAGVAPVLVPADLPEMPYDVALRADLLGGSGNTVVATAYTPARRLRPVTPFRLELAGSAAVEARSGVGPTGKLTGKVLRLGDYKKPVTVTLAGLPAGASPPVLVVPGDKSEFELVVAFPYGLKPGELPNVKVVATGDGTPALKSNAIAVAVKVVPGEPPPQKALAVFEDQPEFVANLKDGGGTAALEAADKYSGTHSVKVTPDQRFNAQLPGLGVKIREKPGPGEYRYLRFAWKKRGGQAICLQLNHDGRWGPTDGKPAKFRYHAGPGPECYGASVGLDARLPADWVVVTRDLFADFGEFTLTGIALSPVDGEYALFDHIYLARTPQELEAVKPQPPAKGAK
jgi:hypothetical protein